MGNFATTYRRRVEKYFATLGVKPKVAPAGTNHIENHTQWDSMTIYKGEIVLNLGDGKIYSSDDSSIIEIARDDGITNGLQVTYPRNGFSGGIARWLSGTDGFASINGKSYKHTSTPATNAGDIQISENSSGHGRYDLIYGKTTTIFNNPSDTNFKLEIKALIGPNSIDELISRADTLPQDSILLAVVYVPGIYNDLSVHMLRPWSVSAGKSQEDQKLNITGITTKPQLKMSPADLMFILQTSFFIETNPPQLKYKRTYLEKQLVVYGNSIYQIINTHFVSTTLADSVANGDAILLIGGGSSGGTTDHRLLSHLGFDDSGHTGFQRKTYIVDRNPTELDDIAFPAEIGNFWMNSVTYELFLCVDNTAGSADWLNLNSTVSLTKDDKDLPALNTSSDGDLATNSVISHTPIRDSYVEVLLNGVLQSIGDGDKTKNCYFSDDGGITAKPISEIEAFDELFWNGTIAGYELSASDSLSFIYIIGISGTWASVGLSGPLWGGTSVQP